MERFGNASLARGEVLIRRTKNKHLLVTHVSLLPISVQMFGTYKAINNSNWLIYLM